MDKDVKNILFSGHSSLTSKDVAVLKHFDLFSVLESTKEVLESEEATKKSKELDDFITKITNSRYFKLLLNYATLLNSKTEAIVGVSLSKRSDFVLLNVTAKIHDLYGEIELLNNAVKLYPTDDYSKFSNVIKSQSSQLSVAVFQDKLKSIFLEDETWGIQFSTSEDGTILVMTYGNSTIEFCPYYNFLSAEVTVKVSRQNTLNVRDRVTEGEDSSLANLKGITDVACNIAKTVTISEEYEYTGNIDYKNLEEGIRNVLRRIDDGSLFYHQRGTTDE